jgi:hypothetical protein
VSTIVWATDWRKVREDRLTHGGVFAWYLKCEIHGREFQVSCVSCGMAQDHNDDITRELIALGLVWLWDEPAGDIPLTANERTSDSKLFDSLNSNTPKTPSLALRGDQESAS